MSGNQTKEQVNSYMREYRKRPEVKKRMAARHAAYQKRPEAIRRAHELRQRPERRSKILAYAKEYRQRPGARARRKELAQRPEAKAKAQAYMREYTLRPKSQARKKIIDQIHKLKKYGLSIDDFNTLFARQGNRCAICGSTSFTVKGPVVDHNHASGKVRGILCGKCNSAIALVNENTETLESAIKYIKRDQDEG